MNSSDARARRPRAPKLVAAALAGVAALAVGVPAASAATCGDDGTTAIPTAGGYIFDLTEGSTTGVDRNQPFATLYDSGSNDPPAPRSSSDAYDDWGALFVGGSADSNLYHDNNNDSCTIEDNGREHVYPVVNVGGLQVQRKIYFPPAGLEGTARILNFVTNPGAAPVTTSVQVGDTLSDDNEGDLGSDSSTGVRATSTGDLDMSAADFWAVTSDDPIATSDPTLGHVFDGPAGADKIDFVTLSGTAAGTGDTNDNFAYRWENVTINPGQTAAFMSFELLAVVDTADAQAEANLAAQRASGLQTAAPGVIYEGMSDPEIAAVRNWAKPPLTFDATAKKKQRVKKLSFTAVCVEKPCQVSGTGSVKAKLPAGGKAKVTRKFKLKPFAASAPAATAQKIPLKLKRKQAKKLIAGLEEGGRAKARVSANAVASSGGQSTDALRIKLKP